MIKKQQGDETLIDKLKHQFQSRTATILGSKDVMKSAVMLPLCERHGDAHILFEVRAFTLQSQPGEICFPGGKVDKEDISYADTAKRELCEELGIQVQEIEVIAPLDILVTPFRGIIYPYLGEINKNATLSPNPQEVDSVFTVPLSTLLEMEPETFETNIHFEPGKQFPFNKIPNQSKYNKRTHTFTELFYYYDEHVIWGLTARILHHFLQTIKEAETKG